MPKDCAALSTLLMLQLMSNDRVHNSIDSSDEQSIDSFANGTCYDNEAKQREKDGREKEGDLLLRRAAQLKECGLPDTSRGL